MDERGRCDIGFSSELLGWEVWCDSQIPARWSQETQKQRRNTRESINQRGIIYIYSQITPYFPISIYFIKFYKLIIFLKKKILIFYNIFYIFIIVFLQLF